MAGLLVALPALALAQESAPQAGPSGDSIGARLDRLENKVRDLQVMVGTLESLLRAKPGTVLPQEAPAVAPDGSLGPRIDALETQITALTNQIERMGKQMGALESKLAAPPMPAAPPPIAEPPSERQSEAPAPSDWAPADSANEPADDLAALLERQAGSEPQNLAAPPPAGDAQTLYQQGYGALLQKDYSGAEIAFSQLVDAYPNDPLAGNAQYWLGESYYVRGQYKSAADAFLKGYKTYKSGDKVPDTLLKLGMALAELGQKDAACSTFDELKTKYPGAPEHIGDEAKAWRKKAGC